MTIQNQNESQKPNFAQGEQIIGGDFFTTLRGLSGGLVAQGVGGEYFTRFRESVTKIASDLLRGLSMTIIPLSRQEYDNLRFSAMVLAFQLEDQPDVVAYHTLILESTGEELKPEMRSIDNQQVRINLVTGDANDTALAELCERAVQETFPNMAVYSVAATVVPTSIDAVNLDHVTAVVRNAAVAGASCLQVVLNRAVPVSLDTISRDTMMVLDMTTGSGCNYDAVGNPQRSSISVSISARKKGRTVGDLSVVNAASDTVKICDVSGFVNPIWAPANQGIAGFGYINPQQQIPVGKLVAEYVITGVHTPFAQSPSAVALALSSVLLVADNNNWVQSLIPKSFSASNDMTEIGALNTICNVGNETANGPWGSVVDTAEMANDLGKFNQFIGKLFRPGTVVSIDCPESTPQSWYLNVFAAAAMNDANAIAAVKEAFDELTAGNFSKFFQANASLFSNATRVPLGYYIAADKQKRDIRDVDLTFICNAFKNNPENIHVYNDTFVPRPNSGPITNLAKREGIISHVLKEQCKITGYAMRCTFSAETITALSQALQAMHLNTLINTPLSIDALRTGTPAPDHISGALVQTTQSYMNNAGMIGPRPGMTFNANQFNFRR